MMCDMDELDQPEKTFNIGVRVPRDLYTALEKRRKELEKKTGFALTVSAVVRSMIEKDLGLKGAR